MEYFSERTYQSLITFEELHIRLISILDEYCERNYLLHCFNIRGEAVGENLETINRKAKIELGFDIFPLANWPNEMKTKGNLFDTIEFIYRYISKPIGWIKYYENGIEYFDYEKFDHKKAKIQFRKEINKLLKRFEDGYELSCKGEILYSGGEIFSIVTTEFPEYDLKNIDLVIKEAIRKWKNRDQSIELKKQAILELTNVFEFLKKDGTLEEVLTRKDTNDLFQIANNFSLRHHNNTQKTDYDKDIWFEWIFHYYLATCVATLRLINKYKV